MTVRFACINDFGIYQGTFDGISATPPDVGWYAPDGAIVARSEPPTDEPGKWIEQNGEWQEVDTAVLASLYMDAVQAHLDNFARSEGRAYDNMLSACTYATSTNLVFGTEGQYCVEARDNTWAAAHQIMNDVLSGQRPVPTWEELEAELPELVWPGPENV